MPLRAELSLQAGCSFRGQWHAGQGAPSEAAEATWDSRTPTTRRAAPRRHVLHGMEHSSASTTARLSLIAASAGLCWDGPPSPGCRRVTTRLIASSIMRKSLPSRANERPARRVNYILKSINCGVITLDRTLCPDYGPTTATTPTAKSHLLPHEHPLHKRVSASTMLACDGSLGLHLSNLPRSHQPQTHGSANVHPPREEYRASVAPAVERYNFKANGFRDYASVSNSLIAQLSTTHKSWVKLAPTT